jgi:predicted glycogen debranching enzyme
MLQKDASTLHNYAESIQCEWLETNGLGGWAGSTLIGCNTRRYHGLLIAATIPPTERLSLVSKLDEAILLNGERFELSTNDYGDVIAPNGYQYLKSFTKNIFPEWIYETPACVVKKTIAMIHGENTTVIIYNIIQAPLSFQLELLPLLSVRGYHTLMQQNNSVHEEAIFNDHTFKTKLYDGTPDIFIKVPGADYQTGPNWYLHFNYTAEKNRGLDFSEDLFTPGKFTIAVQEGDSIGIILSTEATAGKDAHVLFEKEKLRRAQLLDTTFTGSIDQLLILAADQFIVQRGEKLKTIIAGYHWFTDWGRDTMISLPGLCLSTGRYDDAKKILAAFANSVSQGMIPNRFPDNGEAPEYNNADGTLWYFIAIYKYMKVTGDEAFIVQTILPVLDQIIEWHLKGTRYNIHATEDGLLYAGEPGLQLTWMDAKIGNWVVTPRMGKPVEIQALWYNALCIYSELLSLNMEKNRSEEFAYKAAMAKQNFMGMFWNNNNNYLYDNIDENGSPVNEIRPNQLFAISLPFALIEGLKAKQVLQIVKEQLYTPVGLRSLAPTDKNYIPVYAGDTQHRDSAYHQGTVWSWLLGPFIDAVVKLDTENGIQQAKKLIEAFSYHLGEACIGSVSEIFDGDEPHIPKGCVAQAWSVAELLRVIKEYGL